jgi:spermidine synthase
LTDLGTDPRLQGDWFFEVDSLGFLQGLRVKGRLAQVQSPFQHLEVFDTDAMGRVLVLDGALQTSDRDEFMYHEMLVHVPLMTHPDPGEVLIIGGGDGGTLRRVLEHSGTRPTQVEIDAAVVEACKRHMPGISRGAYDDPRTRLVIGDGVQYMRDNPAQFDVVIVDSTDPVGPAVQLFEAPFYRDVERSLTADGLMVAQSNSPLVMMDELRAQVANLRQVFPIVRTYLGMVLGYPGSLWSYTIASKRHDPADVEVADVAARLTRDRITTRYYSPAVHQSAFALPPFIAELVR